MSPLIFAALTVNIAVISSVELIAPPFNHRTNATDAGNNSLVCNLMAGSDRKCNIVTNIFKLAGNIESNTEAVNYNLEPDRWKQTLESLKGKESIWITKMKNHLDLIHFYINILERKFKKLSKVTKELSLTDKMTYLGNPLSQFDLLKRSAKDWAKAALLMNSLPGELNSEGYDTSLSRLHSGYKAHLPNIEDLSSGYRGLARLQRVYDLDTDDLADLKSAAQDRLFSANDFLGFAKVLCTEAQVEKCQEWLKKAIEKNSAMRHIDMSTDNFLQLSFLSNCLNGNQTGANIYFQELLERESTFSLLTDVREFLNLTLERIVNLGCDKIKKELEDFRNSKTLNSPKGSENERFIAWSNLNHNDTSLLELCRYPAVYNVTARLLKCRYVHYNKPQLMIGPFKVEEAHIDPPILLYHNVISDQEISEMMDFIKRKGKLVADDGRTIIGWIKDRQLPEARAVSQRSALMTGWDLSKAEPHQLNSYGPGGEFTLHIDAASDVETFALVGGEADYSTVLFWLSDVKAGGNTVFPALNVSLVPQKGSAAVWLNRKPNGDLDEGSLHAGCPVLEGHKLTITKWFHLHGFQDFPKCTKKMNASYRYFYV